MDVLDGSPRSAVSGSIAPQLLARAVCVAGLVAALLAAGCTSPREYVRNGFKVGPNYCKPAAPVEVQWIDFQKDPRVKADDVDLSAWWKVFNDPQLDQVVKTASQQNLTLRAAGTQILQAQAVLGIAVGNIFPQVQQAVGSYSRNQLSKNTANPAPRPYFNQLATGFNLSWELDFWGLYRRSIESADASLDATVENYDNVLVLLVSNVASTYVQIRTLQQELRLVKENVRLQKDSMKIAEAQWKAGQANEGDFLQTRNNVEQTEALIPPLEASLRQANDALCILLGIPPEDLIAKLGEGPQFPIPTVPADVAVGVPADLLRRRPDVRQAERLAAAQCAQIGVAESELYPHFAINGVIQWQAKNLNQLFTPHSMTGSVGPSFTWNILNYGRLLNGVRQQQALFEQTVFTYQSTVLSAQQETEDALVGFLKAQDQTVDLQRAVRDIEQLNSILMVQAQAGATDWNRVYVIEAQATTQENNLATSLGNVALNLIQVYRALGGGWQIRLDTASPNVGQDAPNGFLVQDLPITDVPRAPAPLNPTQLKNVSGL
jgi:NodT family efflux transporter outer membrane factor (OMF) lipoprotein